MTAPTIDPTTRPAGRPVPDIITEIPGPKARAHVEFDETWTSPSLPRAYPIVPVRGEGLTVEDIDGNLFLDFAAGIAVTSTGHSHPQVVAAIQRAGRPSSSTSAPSDFYLPIYAEVCAELARIAPIEGACAPTSATAARRSWRRRSSWRDGATGRPYIVAFLGAFHGRTYGSVRLTASKAKYHAGFGPLLPGVYHAPYGHVEDLRWFDEVLFDKLAPADEVAAIIVEPIQGEGGYIVPEDGFLAGPARDLRPARHPAHRRRDPVRRGPHGQDVGGRALGRRAGHPADGQGHRQRHAARRAGRTRRAHGVVGPGRPRLDLRRQPRRLRRGARHHRAARGRPGRQRRAFAASRPLAGPASAGRRATRASCATSAARA